MIGRSMVVCCMSVMPRSMRMFRTLERSYKTDGRPLLPKSGNMVNYCNFFLNVIYNNVAF